MKRLVIGILAHVDSGKTTLSEALLYRAGAIRALGRVDHGDAFLDNNALERRRGITIFSKQAVLDFGDCEFSLLDTPGHVDLSAEAERTLSALDYAILVISGTDGVQSHTETLWRLLRRYRVPVFLFINKMDMAGADRGHLMAELKSRLSGGCVDFGLAGEPLAEELALCDDVLTERYLGGGLAPDDINTAIARRKVFPCFFGSALRLTGVDEFLAGLERCTREPERHELFGAKVIKITEEGSSGRLTHMAVTGGSLRVKDLLGGTARDGSPWSEKADQLRIYSGAKFRTADEVFPGTVCAVAGLTKTYPGEGLGAEAPAAPPALEPVLTCRAELPESMDIHTALSYFHRIEEEIPELHVVYNGQLGEIHVQLMGQVQLEILKSLMLERFGMEVSFGHGGMIYKETILSTVEGVGHYEPLRHYAEVHLLLEPGEPGSGLHFETACREDDLDRNWQNLVLTHLEEKAHLGVLTGSPITDMKITLVAGRAHQKHTEGGDFRQATYRAVRQGLRQAESVLLEPWYEFSLELPAEALGRAMNDIQRMSGSFEPPDTMADGFASLRGRAPVSTMQDYQMEVGAYTGGRGRLSCALLGYLPCHNADEVIAAIGYNCDGDVENTADSVFCSHGAGIGVKWDEVYAHMHIPPMKERRRQPESSYDRLAAGAVVYCGTLAEDKELLRIFERTYGPIRRDLYTAMEPARRVEQLTAEAPEEKEYLLVDGYNIIFAWDDLKALARDSLDAARAQLINVLCNYKGVRRCELILVFDAYRVKDSPGSVERIHNINVVYTREAETADMYIEKVTHELGRRRRVRVATSDGMEQLIVLGHGARRISAAAFRQEVDEVTEAIRTYIASLPGAEG